MPVTTAPFQKCQVMEEERVCCGSPDVTAEKCEAINCCFDGQHCYYGKAVTVQCTRDGQVVVVVARDATLPHLDVESVSLLQGVEPSCRPAAATLAFVVFQFPVTACGTTLTEEKGFLVYENHLSSSYEVGIGPRGSIMRDSQFDLLFQCRYSATAVEALIIEVNPVPPPHPVSLQGPLRVELRLANGQCHSKGCADGKEAYTSFYTAADYPVTKVLREPVYVEVRILERTDPNIVLTLEHCWATSSPNPENLPQWDLLINGCPYRDDRYLTTVVPVDESTDLGYPTHYKRFIIKMFTFVDRDSFSPLKEMVFIHCSAAVCQPSATTSCVQTCHRQRRDVSFKSTRRYDTVVSSGEVILTQN
ncbi:zona pellucida sperm-binding protein 4-like [Aplochiton taeniatus]